MYILHLLNMCCHQSGKKDTPVYLLKELASGDSIKGPALLIDNTFTAVVEPNCVASITPTGDITITISDSEGRRIGYNWPHH